MDATLLAELEQRFGSDAALGVYFEFDDTHNRLTMAECDEMYKRLGDAMPGGQSFFPDGSSAVECTNYAVQVFRAYPGRVRIVGFANEDNPTSKVAREEIHPGGHDFALLDERYLVDPWIRLVACEAQQIVYDLTDPVDAAVVLDTYGPQACWEHMVAAQDWAIKHQ